LKTAQIKVKCFSLKQLEMFDLFFLRPSMHVMLEYGWNADIIKRNTDIDSRLFSKKKHDDYITKFSEIVTDVRTSKSEYLDTLKTTDGNYDYMAGKVTNFSYSPAEDGTYDIDLQLSAGNELQLWMPIKQSNTKSTVPKQSNVPAETPYNSWVRRIEADFKQPLISEKLTPQSKWENEFFNWGVLNDRDETKMVSFNEYISFKLILKLLNTQQLFKSKDTITVNYIDSQKNEVIPMNSNKYMISSSDDIIIPNEMPEFKFSEKKKNVLIIDDVPHKVKQPYKGINKKIFNLNDNNLTAIISGSNSPLISGNDVKYGNLLNIFFKYNTILQIYNESFTQADFINGVLSIVNDNTYGLCKMELMAFDDASDSTGKRLQIMDYKLLQSPPIDETSVYRFKIGPTNSFVREFNFSMELSALAEAQALYQSQLNFNSILDKDAFIGSKPELGLNDDRYLLFDMSYAKNSDGYFSINEIEKQSVIKTAQLRIANEIEGLEQVGLKSDTDSGVDKPIDNLEEVLKSKSIKFKISDKEKTIKEL
jgi:hypothetical protein